ncbi:TPA: hypothetical protein ACHOZF_003711 [Raoultella planticola]|nr:hypothetical protein [Raoultella planticola]
MPWDDGVYINNVAPMLIAKVGKNSEAAGWIYKTIETTERALLREDNITWEPERICAVHISMINLMAAYRELSLSEDNISYFKDKYSVDLYEETLYLSKTRLFMISRDALKPINNMTLVLSLEDGSGYVASERDRLDKWCEINNVSGSIMNIICF